MPPKKGKGKKEEEKKKDEPVEAYVKPLPTDKELKLKSQLESLTVQLSTLKSEANELCLENDFLQQETHQTKLETQEYMNYMSKKTGKRQNAVITFSDRNKEQIGEIESRKLYMMEKFANQKTELNDKILSRESELASIRQELDNLGDYKTLQEKQGREIMELEKKVAEERVKHSEAVQRLKAQFLDEKKRFQNESDETLGELSREAKKEAHNCLVSHTKQISVENRALRRELLSLIESSRALHIHKRELEDQQKVLARDQEYANNIQMLRETRRDDIYETYGMGDLDLS